MNNLFDRETIINGGYSSSVEWVNFERRWIISWIYKKVLPNNSFTIREDPSEKILLHIENSICYYEVERNQTVLRYPLNDLSTDFLGEFIADQITQNGNFESQFDSFEDKVLPWLKVLLSDLNGSVDFNLKIHVISGVFPGSGQRLIRSIYSSPDYPDEYYVIFQSSGDSEDDEQEDFFELSIDAKAAILDSLWAERINHLLVPKTVIEALEQLADDKQVDVRRAIARQINNPAILKRLSADESIKSSVADNPNTPIDLLSELAADNNSYIRQVVASNPNASLDILSKLAEDDSWDVRKAVAENPSSSQDILLLLSYDSHFEIQHASNHNPNIHPSVKETLRLAQASDTSKEKLSQLALCSIEDVRIAVASNPNTPSETLEQLANSEYSRIVESVLRNPNTPNSILEAFVKKEFFKKLYVEDIRRSIAHNPAAPFNIFSVLSQDKSYYRVRWDVASNPHTPPELLIVLSKDRHKDVKGAVASNPNTPESIITKLSKSVDEDIRMKVAENININPAILEKLAEDESWDVRKAVAENPNTPFHLLIKLVSKFDYAVLRNPSCPEEIITNLSLAKSANTSSDILARLTDSTVPSIKKAVASNPNISFDTQNKLAIDEDVDIRCLVAENIKASPLILEKLAEDENRRVREAVAGNLNTPAAVLDKMSEDKDFNIRLKLVENPNSPNYNTGLDSFIVYPQEYIVLKAAESSALTIKDALKLSKSLYPKVREKIVSFLVKQL